MTTTTKAKDKIIAVISGVVLIGAVYFMYTILFPKANTTKSTSGQTEDGAVARTITGKIDTSTLDKVKAYKDYGSATLDDIGRVNPFGPIN